MPIEFTIQGAQCTDCQRVEAKDYWKSVVQGTDFFIFPKINDFCKSIKFVYMCSTIRVLFDSCVRIYSSCTNVELKYRCAQIFMYKRTFRVLIYISCTNVHFVSKCQFLWNVKNVKIRNYLSSTSGKNLWKSSTTSQTQEDFLVRWASYSKAWNVWKYTSNRRNPAWPWLFLRQVSVGKSRKCTVGKWKLILKHELQKWFLL